MRRRGAFEVKRNVGAVHEEGVPQSELADVHTDAHGRVFTRSPKPDPMNVVATPSPEGDAEGAPWVFVGAMRRTRMRSG